jgi:hypothetical protein
VSVFGCPDRPQLRNSISWYSDKTLSARLQFHHAVHGEVTCLLSIDFRKGNCLKSDSQNKERWHKDIRQWPTGEAINVRMESHSSSKVPGSNHSLIIDYCYMQLFAFYAPSQNCKNQLLASSPKPFITSAKWPVLNQQSFWKPGNNSTQH